MAPVNVLARHAAELFRSAQSRAAQPAPAFEYGTLLPGHLRFLKVKSESHLHLDCELWQGEFRRVEPCGHYVALSYVWGEGPADQEITLNGRPFRVRSNVISILKAWNKFQQQSFGGYEMSIWIDAICINQDDPAEKSNQIPLMDKIFGYAGFVVVWLEHMSMEDNLAVDAMEWYLAKLELDNMNEQTGPVDRSESSSESRAARLRCLKTFKQCSTRLKRRHGIRRPCIHAFGEFVDIALQTHLQNYSQFYSSISLDWLRDRQDMKDLFPPEHHIWEQFLLIMSDPWFRRVWTWQETVLQENVYLLFQDGRSVKWLVVAACRTAIYNTQAQDSIWEVKRIPRLPTACYDSDDFFESLRGPGSFHGYRETTFLDLLLESGRRQATEMKDHVYGILGLATEETRSAITINYQRSDAEVFVEAFHIAMNSQPAAVLPTVWEYYQDRFHSFVGLPSWCPDISCRKRVRTSAASHFHLGKYVADKYAGLAATTYYADCKSLSFNALYLGYVDRCATEAPYFDTLRFYNVAPQQDVEDAYYFFDRQYLTDLREWLYSMQSAFLSDYEGDAFDTRSAALTTALKSFQPPDWLADCNIPRLLQCCNELHYDGDYIDFARFPRYETGPFSTLDLLSYLMAAVVQHGGRYFFEMNCGKFGWSPKPVLKGDKIFLVPGGKALHVISADGTSYVTTAYVDGYLKNALETLPEDKIGAWEMVHLTK